MVKLTLLLKATLDNITDLKPASETHEFFFKIQCSSCHETAPEAMPINRQEMYPLPGSRGEASFVWKCPFCKRDSSLSFLPPTAPASGPLKAKKNAKVLATTDPLPIVESDQWTIFLTVEGRGLECVGFEFTGTWSASVPEKSTKFTDIEFEDGRWDEYDEESAMPCTIEDLEFKWEKA